MRKRIWFKEIKYIESYNNISYKVRMTRLTKLNKLKGFLQGAPKANIAKMENVL